MLPILPEDPYLLLLKEHSIGKGRNRKVVYRYLYSDASIVYSRHIDLLLLKNGKAEFIPARQWCNKCYRENQFIYYKTADKLYCITCTTELTDKDDRPKAKMYEWTNKPKV